MSNPYGNSTSGSSSQVRFASGVNLVLGLWLIASPFIFQHGSSGWNSIIVGAVIAILAWIRVANPNQATWLSWINVILGIWIFISPWVYGYSANAGALWNNLIVGAIIFIFGIWSALATRK